MLGEAGVLPQEHLKVKLQCPGWKSTQYLLKPK